MRIVIGSDHGGYELKEALKYEYSSRGIEILDCGPSNDDSCDYPDFGFPVAEAVAEGKADFGIAICKSGIGMSIVANKVKGIRAALCLTPDDGESARRHNYANVVTLSALRTSPQLGIAIFDAFLNARPEGGRHKRRIDKIIAYDEKHRKKIVG